jgi:hypothetical protein
LAGNFLFDSYQVMEESARRATANHVTRGYQVLLGII